MILLGIIFSFIYYKLDLTRKKNICMAYNHFHFILFHKF